MKESMDINSILNAAIKREEEAYKFYKDVAERMDNKAVREAFQQFAEDELGHKDFLKNCLKDPSLLKNLPVPKDYKVAEATEAPLLSVDMKPADAMALAMKKEQEAAEFYLKLAKTAVNSQYQEAFRGLANMELDHKTRIEALFVGIGYPEVF
ncbi:MAG TPA: ferritin family protein [Thermodesulfobacteriota bacterium]|nr:ferritin family protein [Deltaproteobacteria bacterium]HNR13717.1 ferritin family protein [Thermodesulfobacteriota bacterium]HNU70160.1 ferritin family protein [Thermodesulfobacteriota bacterium]